MARVRFYELGSDRYISLRIEERGVYIEEQEYRIRRRKNVPITKKAQSQVAALSIEDTANGYEQTELLHSILDTLQDFQVTFNQDPKASVTLKPGYKGKGLQLGVFYRGEWENFAGANLLECLMLYYQAVLAE